MAVSWRAVGAKSIPPLRDATGTYLAETPPDRPPPPRVARGRAQMPMSRGPCRPPPLRILAQLGLDGFLLGLVAAALLAWAWPSRGRAAACCTPSSPRPSASGCCSSFTGLKLCPPESARRARALEAAPDRAGGHLPRLPRGRARHGADRRRCARAGAAARLLPGRGDPLDGVVLGRDDRDRRRQHRRRDLQRHALQHHRRRCHTAVDRMVSRRRRCDPAADRSSSRRAAAGGAGRSDSWRGAGSPGGRRATTARRVLSIAA